MSLLVDTNVLIYAYRDKGGCRQRLEASDPRTIAVSILSVIEVEVGIAKSLRPESLQIFLDDTLRRYRVLALDAAVARTAGQLRASLESSGRSIGQYDTLIAATALAHDLTVVTRNLREFGRVPGLRVEDWYV